ncbi:hypothetical protein RhiirA1_511644 [Rhizophagus irregularis]|uniref:Uncharacterized protein n=3 Tax=Rhizophagus irregularis TaxID=588596 RepID=U9UPF7_RHIID|nr:hypothetical protein GLOIN_2v1474176 [Rhizophagus irregularis DAOM 181602=DAOM 197198]EXX61398.1 hypothetical protein RirG_171560 [Rhizophagus irregularis DAOM 197198w]PKC66646.1 hypothetical protein RhiirA1_511644 [Rhizophagus irregularis]PKY22140.1 hypothetical protein RhiirB3_435972 [Rhizophagus irregularis]POG77069.1 hypothetical protein GLOIN_2v1474176 [Rhizophagus irregularis DAOM 181602=DAOM 197198]UZO14423.1 hypothetical protein OCT59_005880 [Rhizophagus irregularis]|eukprot:XP_025183935.1 hypothetical protein GLOIN_2v1474176 [Rhizophagus irregularis DAOM 181602=DAOM 197198]
MKIFILLIGLLLLLIVNVKAQLTCEKYFGVSLCNECQKELWNSGQSPSTCTFFNKLFAEVQYDPYTFNYNLTSYDKAVKKACSIEFSCTYEEGKQIWERVEEKCANELTIYVDWSANPSSLDETVVAPYATLLLFYFAVPEYSSLCHKTSNGELCGIESIRPLVDWLKQEIPEGKVQFSYDFLFAYKEDGTRIKVPMELVTKCSECGKNMMKEYKNWMDQHAVPDPIVKNMFNGSLEAVQEYFSCPILL